MRPLELLRAFALFGVWLAWSSPGANADDPQPAPVTTAAKGSDGADPDVALERALNLERQRKWASAIDVYEQALERWPGRAEFRHRLRLCEAHYRLGRRYQDRSFRGVLLHLSRDEAMRLFDELIERIESHYVEPVALDPLLRRGLDNLEVALRDPAFLQANTPTASGEQVKHLRDEFRRRRDRLAARTRGDAQEVVHEACDIADEVLGIGPAAVVLEFAFGACDALDDYTSYLTPDKLDELFSMIDGNFVGLGVELKFDDHGLRLVGVIRGGPADLAGLKTGDWITAIGGQPIAGLGLDEAAGRLQGSEGTAVDLVVTHPNGQSRSLRLVRRPVEVHSVAQTRIVDPKEGVGYIQLTGFQKSSTEELGRAIESLERQGMRYLVLDLRGNPGGLLNIAVEIADAFLDQGVIVSTRGRAANQSAVYRARAGVALRMPMAILLDHDSASASEILAGALKDHHRALVIGERSYGKGSVQSIFPLKTAPAGLKLTTARFYSPLNRAYSEQGVEPDVAVRVAARPTSESAGHPAVVEFGDPETDPVLEAALEQARRRGLRSERPASPDLAAPRQ